MEDGERRAGESGVGPVAPCVRAGRGQWSGRTHRSDVPSLTLGGPVQDTPFRNGRPDRTRRGGTSAERPSPQCVDPTFHIWPK